MRSAREGLQSLHAALAAQGGPVAEALREPPAVGPRRSPARPRSPARARAPRARRGEYELLIEMILEGSRLHYGEPALVAPADPDLRLLLGDQLYALGLNAWPSSATSRRWPSSRTSSRSSPRPTPRATPARVEAIWAAGARAIGWGADGAHEAVKAGFRASTEAAYGVRRATQHRDER